MFSAYRFAMPETGYAERQVQVARRRFDRRPDG